MSVPGSPAPQPAVPLKPAAAVPGARLALVLLLSINLFNYIDRQVLSAVLPDIQKSLPLPPGEPEFWLGLLASAFLVAYMLFSPVFGLLADRMSRWWLVSIGVLIWSLASGASGLAKTYMILLLTRCLVGIGEAAYGPVAPAMIADLFPVEKRGKVLSWFYVAIPVGSALGYTLGGIVASSDLGWRWAFFLVVPPGILLAILCLIMPEPPRGLTDLGAAGVQRQARMRDYLILLKTPSYVLVTLGMTAMTFSMGALGTWMPHYLKDRGVTDFRGINAVAFFGGLTALAGLSGTILGGIVGDRLRTRLPGSYFLVSGVSMILGCPLVLLVIWTPFDLAWLFIFLSVFCLFVNTGPTNTILANVAHPSLRATGFALNILIIHALGDVPSPPLVGWIRAVAGWPVAFGVVAGMMVVGGLLWLWGGFFLQRDTELAPRRLPA